MVKTRGYYASCGQTLRRTKNTISSSSWTSIPLEIRLMILEEVSRQKHRGWASCAAVCKEWQVVIEKRNFHRLKLRISCLQELEDIVIRQRPLVQHLWLNIELPRYTCRCCRWSESMSQISRHSSIVRNSILKLFSILSTWQPTGGLVLELNAYSPSDSEHWFKYLYSGPNYDDNGDVIQQKEATTEWHDPDHGWADGRQFEAPGVGAITRSLSPLCFSLPNNIPMVHAVTGLVIRRQLRRQFVPAALRLLWERLPRLESIVYEPWRICRLPWKISRDEGMLLYRPPV